MHSWKAIATHLFFISSIPLFLTIRWVFNQNYFSDTTRPWLALAVISWLCILTRVTIPFFRSPLRHLPRPRGDRLIFGHARHERPQTQVFLDLMREVPNDGAIGLYGLFHVNIAVLITRTDLVLDVVNSRAYDWQKPGPAKKILGKTLGNGLVNVEGSEHKAMRKAVAPAFSGRHIRDLVPLFYHKGLAFADSIARASEVSPERTVEIANPMARVTLDIIGAAGVGKDFNTIENDEDELARLYESITSPNKGNFLVFIFVNIWLPSSVIRLMYGTPFAKRAQATVDLRHKIRELLAEKKRAIKPDTAEKDIISIIMRSGDFSDDYLCSQLLTFLAAG
jgi:cytochrome P450